MQTAQKLLTADEFYALPEPPGAGKMELVRGEVVVMAPVGGIHGDLVVYLGFLVLPFVHEQGLGRIMTETGYRLARNPDVVRAPDLSFISGDRQGLPTTYVDGPPILAVEVTSPDDRDGEVQTKVDEYLEAGTLRVWVVRPDRQTVTVHRPGGDAHTFSKGDAVTSDDAGFAVEGFTLPLAMLFEH
jgi:Uma2 family endonuclease